MLVSPEMLDPPEIGRDLLPDPPHPGLDWFSGKEQSNSSSVLSSSLHSGKPWFIGKEQSMAPVPEMDLLPDPETDLLPEPEISIPM